MDIKSIDVPPLTLEQKQLNGQRNIENSDSEYLVTFNLKVNIYILPKIIYQAYKYGVDKNSVSDHGLYIIISPYALTDNFTDEYKLKLVKHIKIPMVMNLCSYFTPPLGFIIILL